MPYGPNGKLENFGPRWTVVQAIMGAQEDLDIWPSIEETV
jgi:hypothetical protein